MNADSKPNLEKAPPATGDQEPPEASATVADPAEASDAALAEPSTTELSQLPPQETLNSIEDWSFGYVFCVVCSSMAPSPIVELGSLGAVAFGLRTMWLLRALNFREVIPASANCRIQLLLLPVVGLSYRANQDGPWSMWAGGFMAVVVFLIMQELLNISSVVNRVKKKIELREKTARGANDLLPPPSPDKKVGGKGGGKKKKKG